MPSISASSLVYQLPDGARVLDGVDLALGPGRFGLTGPNGGGKSTLLRLIAGELRPTSGSCAAQGHVGYLPQRLAADPGAPVAALLGVDGKLAALRRIEAGAAGVGDFDQVDADWDLEERVKAELDRLGLGRIGLDRPVGSVSGGEAVALAFAGLVARRPGVMLLDEPTNNLDAEARARVADGLGRFRGVALVVTHDPALLDLMGLIGELRAGRLRWLPAPYDAYRAAKRGEADAALRRIAQAKSQVKAEQRDRAEAQTKQARRDAHGRRQASSLPKILANARRRRAEETAGRGRGVHEARLAAARERLEEARAGLEAPPKFRLELPETTVPAGRLVLELDRVRPAHTDLEVSLLLRGPERVALTGPNGVGKTSLARCVLGWEAPEAGTVALHVPARALPQDLGLLDDSLTVLENMSLGVGRSGGAGPELRPPGWPGSVGRIATAAAAGAPAPGRGAIAAPLSPAELRDRLARLGFRGDRVDQVAGTLSGGERWRATLAALLLRGAPPQLLVLDEPTNNLDFDSREFLDQALAAYRGTLILISHDERFLRDAGATRVVALG